MKKFLLAVVVMLSTIGCTRIETGTVGLRVDSSRQIQLQELQPGTWNQVLIGDVLEFPVKDIVVTLENKTPLTADNTPLSDFDLTVIYGINPASVAEIYTKKSRSFHANTKDGILLMSNYVQLVVNNAAYKVVREYTSLDITNNREKMETEILNLVNSELTTRGLANDISITAIQIRNILPNAEVMKSAVAAVKAQNELKVKATEVEIAKKEAERMAALANNSKQSIEYMQAQAALNISEGVKNGKVQTIIVPSNFTSLYTAK